MKNSLGDFSSNFVRLARGSLRIGCVLIPPPHGLFRVNFKRFINMNMFGHSVLLKHVAPILRNWYNVLDFPDGNPSSEIFFQGSIKRPFCYPTEAV